MSQVIRLGGGGGGSGSVTSVVTDSGTATPVSGVLNIITGNSSNNTGETVLFTGSGNTVELNFTSPVGANTYIGQDSGLTPNGGFTQQINVGLGYEAVGSNQAIAGFISANVGIGNQALGNISNNCSNNTAVGSLALTALNGSSEFPDEESNNNIAIGFSSGTNYAGPNSNNILINNVGNPGDQNVIWIGTDPSSFLPPPSSNGYQTTCYIAGIQGVTLDNEDGIPVLISPTNAQLGTSNSSIRYKENVRDMGDYSSSIMNLRPVTFNYKKSKLKKKSVGLIAEEVEKIAPDLVVYNKKGEVETLKYQDLTPLLLNELQKLRKEFEEYKRSKK